MVEKGQMDTPARFAHYLPAAKPGPKCLRIERHVGLAAAAGGAGTGAKGIRSAAIRFAAGRAVGMAPICSAGCSRATLAHADLQGGRPQASTVHENVHENT